MQYDGTHRFLYKEENMLRNNGNRKNKEVKE